MQHHISAEWSSSSSDCQTPESGDTRFHQTKLVATRKSCLEPGGLHDLGHAMLQEWVYETKIKGVLELCKRIVDETG